MKKIMTALIKNRSGKVETTDTSSRKSSQNNYAMRSVLPRVTEQLSRQEDISATSAAQECASLPGFHDLQILVTNLSRLQSLPVPAWRSRTLQGIQKAQRFICLRTGGSFFPELLLLLQEWFQLCPVHLPPHLFGACSLLSMKRHQKEAGRQV